MSTQAIYNYRKVDDQCITGGQPTEEDLKSAADEGFQTVINLATINPRYSLEDEAGFVRSLGMLYYHIPVDWGSPTESDFAAFEQVMRALPDGKTLIHCAANFRVTAFYSLYALKHLGWSATQADTFRASIWQGSDYRVWEAFISHMKAQIADSPTSQHAIRFARPTDLAALPIIERAAAAQFRATPYAYLADDDLVSADVDLDHEDVWVVVDHADQPIGFVLVHLLDESVHLHELDVHPRYARRGLGRRLIAVVADWARARGATALTLTTFDDIAWNGPYYARLGFRTLDVTALSPGLQAVRQAEAANGLPMEHRICMQLDL